MGAGAHRNNRAHDAPRQGGPTEYKVGTIGGSAHAHASHSPLQLAVVGDGAVGKTPLIVQLVESHYTEVYGNSDLGSQHFAQRPPCALHQTQQ